MKLAPEMSVDSLPELPGFPESPDPDECLEPPAGRMQVAPDPLILDRFDPALSYREAKERAMTRWERWYVAQLLEFTRGNLSEAARIAHSDRGHLRKLARKHLAWDSRSSPSD